MIASSAASRPETAQTAPLPGVSVSACLIVRNEERFLEGCLQSLVDRVDEIVVVDTGSTDATFEILERFGIEPKRFSWVDDFAAARNEALAHAAGSWILYIDADERLGLPCGGMLKEYIDPGAVACNVCFRPKTGFTRYLEPRLFRSDPRLFFEGRIHETMVPRIRELIKVEGLAVVDTRVEIDHLGYDGDLSHKYERDLGLLERAVQLEPERVYYWYHLTETLAAMGRRPAAMSAAASGLAAARRDVSGLQSAEASLMYQSTARLELESDGNPMGIIEEGLAKNPNDFGLMFLHARALLKASCFSEAIATVEQLVAIDPRTLPPSRLAYDEAIFGAASFELAAVACLRTGRLQDAGAWYRRAAALSPGDLAAQVRAAAFAPSGKDAG